MDEDEKKMLFNEINNLKDLDHPNILKMYEFFEDENTSGELKQLSA
jgi:serine/threonine protein kinase